MGTRLEIGTDEDCLGLLLPSRCGMKCTHGKAETMYVANGLCSVISRAGGDKLTGNTRSPPIDEFRDASIDVLLNRSAHSMKNQGKIVSPGMAVTAGSEGDFQLPVHSFNQAISRGMVGCGPYVGGVECGQKTFEQVRLELTSTVRRNAPPYAKTGNP